MNPSGMIVLPGAGQSLWGRCREMFAAVFGIDTRALAAFRIGLAICLMLNVADHVTSLSAHFADAGLLPRAALGSERASWYSLHTLSGDPEWQLALFALGALAATGMLVGYRTRLCTAISWLLMMSLQARNPAITDASDALLRMLLFWGLFLPLSTRASLDASREGGPAPQRLADVRTAALILQAMFVYLVAGYLKASAAWITGGSEVEMILRRGEYSRWLGTFLGGFPGLCYVATVCTGVFEVAGPLLLLSPFATARVRLVLLPMFVGLHVGFAFCLDVGQFPYRSLVSLIPLIPACAWDLVWPSKVPAHQRDAPAPEDLCTVCVSILLAIVISLNVTAAMDKNPMLADPAAALVDVLRLDQNWNMFTCPTDQRVWFTVRAIAADGTATDLLMDRPWTSARPDVRQSASLGYRSYKHLEFIGDQQNSGWRVPALQGLVRQGARAGRIQGCPVRVELLCHRQPIFGTAAKSAAIETLELAWMEQSAVAIELDASR